MAKTDYRTQANALDSVLTLQVPSGGTSKDAADTGLAAYQTYQMVNQAKKAVNGLNGNLSRLSGVDPEFERNLLSAAKEAAIRQAYQASDYAVDKGVKELQRNQEDAQLGFKNQLKQIDADERNALDNQVLYAEARGDRGGIGKEQYSTVQNAAMNNRYNVSLAQAKLATDTGRQIADLRAQGEFEKADKLLDISQDYLTKLMNLEKWADEQNIGVDKFNIELEKWEKDYAFDAAKYVNDIELDVANATGAFASGIPTAKRQQQMTNNLVSAGKAMMSAGLTPTSEQLEAMGWSEPQYWQWRMSNPSPTDLYSNGYNPTAAYADPTMSAYGGYGNSYGGYGMSGGYDPYMSAYGGYGGAGYGGGMTDAYGYPYSIY